MKETSKPEPANPGTDAEANPVPVRPGAPQPGQVTVPETRILELLGNAVTQRNLGAMQLQIEGMQAELQQAQVAVQARVDQIKDLEKQNEHLKNQVAEFQKNAAALDDTSKVKG